MLGADRSVHGGVSAVVNNLYQAGIEEKIDLCYIGTMVDGTKIQKLVKAFKALLLFFVHLPRTQIVHVHMAADASFYRKKIFIDLAKLSGKKIVIHEHGGNFQKFYYPDTISEKQCLKRQDMIRKTLNKADLFLVLSKEWRDFFAPIVKQDKLVILHNGILVPKNGKMEYNDHNVIFLGRICKDKGIAELLSAFDIVRKEIPDAMLYLAGQYEDSCFKMQVDERSAYVTYLGWIDGDTREHYLREICSVFVLPTYYEGQPISLLEAMAMGNAVVTTAVGGIPQIVDQDVNGIMIEPKNTEQLAKTLIGLLNDTDRKKQLGSSAREKIQAEFELSKSIETLTDLYYEVL